MIELKNSKVVACLYYSNTGCKIVPQYDATMLDICTVSFGLKVSPFLFQRFCYCLNTKPFLLLISWEDYQEMSVFSWGVAFFPSPTQFMLNFHDFVQWHSATRIRSDYCGTLYRQMCVKSSPINWIYQVDFISVEESSEGSGTAFFFF